MIFPRTKSPGLRVHERHRGTAARTGLRGTRLLVLLIATWAVLAPWATMAESGDGASSVLHLGVFPRRAASVSRQMYAPLVEHLSRELGVTVELHTPPDYLSFWRDIEAERFDITHYNQYHYLRAHRALGHRLLARNREHGRDDIRAMIVVKRDTNYTSLGDLRGRKILFGGGRDAMVSYIMAVDLLRREGLESGDYLADFAQNPPKAALAMFYGQADAAAVGEPVPHDRILEKKIGKNALRTLATSEPEPHLPWAVSRRVDPATADRIRSVLLTLGEHPGDREVLDAMQVDGFSPAADADYDSLRRIVERVLGEYY